MATLMFIDRGWVVVTNSWTAASKNEGETRIVYTWGADGISFFDSATGTSSITLSLSISDFISRVQNSGKICDLRV